MKGLVLAGGTATRLFPLTIVTNKHLLPIYDRPMIYYPIETLTGMGITEAMIIVGGKGVGDVVELLADGAHFGLDLTYRFQQGALGIAHAIGLARKFVGHRRVLRRPRRQHPPRAGARRPRARVRGRPVGRRHAPVPGADPERFGVAELSPSGEVLGFEEKPAVPKSNLIPIGVYFLRPSAFPVIESLAMSDRGELEITDLLNHFVATGRFFAREYAGNWTDAGTVPSLLRASELAAEAEREGRLAAPVARPR